MESRTSVAAGAEPGQTMERVTMKKRIQKPKKVIFGTLEV